MFLKCCKSQRGLTSCRLNSIWTSMFFSKLEILSFLAFHRSSFADTRRAGPARAGPARAQPARAGPSHAKSDRKLDTRSDTPLEEHHVDDERFFWHVKASIFSYSWWERSFFYVHNSFACCNPLQAWRLHWPDVPDKDGTTTTATAIERHSDLVRCCGQSTSCWTDEKRPGLASDFTILAQASWLKNWQTIVQPPIVCHCWSNLCVLSVMFSHVSAACCFDWLP